MLTVLLEEIQLLQVLISLCLLLVEVLGDSELTVVQWVEAEVAAAELEVLA